MAASIPSLLTVLATGATVATQVKSEQDRKKAAKDKQRASEEKAVLLKQQATENELERKRRLKTALATQKALFGARGISASSGSAMALATKAMQESANSANLNKQKNALQLNQLQRGNNFSQTKSILNISNTVLGSIK